MPRRRSVRLTLIILAALVLILFFSARSIATFYTDYLWFKELGQASVFWVALRTKILLGLIFGVAFFVLVYVNLLIVDRLAPVYVPSGPEEEVLGRYRDAVAPYRRWIRLGLAGVLGFFVGTTAVSHWSEALLAVNRVDFGVKDPQFGKDVGFLVFQLPFYEFLVNWFLASLIFVTIITAVVHYVNGGIRFQSVRRERVIGSVKVHLSVLFGVLALFKGLGYWLNRYQLLYSDRGFPFARGASATDVNAQLPALTLLTFIMVAIAVAFIVNIWVRGWLLPVVALASWILLSVVVGGLFPLIYQRVKVTPQEAQAERPFIDRNLKFTQMAFDLDVGTGAGTVTTTAFAGTPALAPADVAANAVTIKNTRLWDPRILPETYDQLQSLRNFYEFNDVDVDRYAISSTDTATGQVTTNPQQVLLGVRELNQAMLPSQSWVNVHLQFTHGYGMAMSEATSVEPQSGLPVFLVRDIPVQVTGTDAQESALTIKEPRIYYGEGPSDYAIVKTGQPEFDFPTAQGTNVETVYAGRGGIQFGGGITGLFRRAAFSLRFANVNPLISGQIKGDSRILFHRDVADRIHTLAPFLALDSDPYAAIVNGRVVWIQDAYTATSKYPYSQVASTSRLRSKAFNLKEFQGVNYIRNSVKAVVDAYDGTVTLYVVDKTDPIVNAYAKLFPSLFTFSDPSPELRVHFRYPEDLFRVQSDLYGQYHVTDPDVFYRQEDARAIPANPSDGLPPEAGADDKLMEPYYLLMNLPHDPTTREEFVILQPFTPKGKQNMVSFVVGRSDPEKYGELVDYRLPKGTAIEGPNQVFAKINQDQSISSLKTLLSQQGSRFIQGNLLVVPVKQSILYVQPIYVTSSREGSQFPQFNSVVVVYGTDVRRGTTLDDALSQIFGVVPSTPPGQGEQPQPGTTPTIPPSTTGTVSADVAATLAQAQQECAAADDALKRGDLGAFQQHYNVCRDLLNKASQQAAAAGGSSNPSAPGATGTAGQSVASTTTTSAPRPSGSPTAPVPTASGGPSG